LDQSVHASIDKTRLFLTPVALLRACLALRGQLQTFAPQ
jgi:hypothetical protein